ncbi:unnamed protein product (macronuclear) [Paramecium tetraurelia]|uniref:Uncharacterized protein n=1 Tax=Paramecium tetraurelia TaxID=5888 RepID=A0D2K4_PARTE|nr:uncharacterized protein GSPATT00012779001 [Paramecium tetraurelia]CAK77271.1 unnamed protein product [Paramecium tetraurelia]|eukprot:XP_001444668.1 hypothetical protein (macronuclear) [Paramecium tetraurelia strain d4-2]
MKSILIALLVIAVIADEACVKEKCPNQYNACVAEVFGCASKALNCKNKCGEADPCYHDCAYESKNKKLIDLYECGLKYCPNTGYWNLILQGCNVEQCVADFQVECLQSTNLRAVECLMNFSQRHPECDCLNE